MGRKQVIMIWYHGIRDGRTGIVVLGTIPPGQLAGTMSLRKQAPGWQRGKSKSEPAGEGAGSGIESWQTSQGLNFVRT